MIRSRLAVPAILLVAAAPMAAQADACRRPDSAPRAKGERECRPQDRVVPHDPDAVRTGRSPGFVDLGNGTEVKIGGRVRFDYDVRR